MKNLHEQGKEKIKSNENWIILSQKKQNNNEEKIEKSEEQIKNGKVETGKDEKLKEQQINEGKKKTEKKLKKLKPVIFTWGKYNYHKNSLFKQNLLLKAMQQTTDISKMKRLTGIKSAAEIYRTLDKMAIRKEYHQALSRQGIDLDTIIAGIKNLCVNSDSDNVKLSGLKTLLKSLGLDEYREDASVSPKNWEEKMKDLVQKENNVKNTDDVKEIKDYKVCLPEAPKEELEKRKEEDEEGGNLYKL